MRHNNEAEACTRAQTQDTSSGGGRSCKTAAKQQQQLEQAATRRRAGTLIADGNFDDCHTKDRQQECEYIHTNTCVHAAAVAEQQREAIWHS